MVAENRTGGFIRRYNYSRFVFAPKHWAFDLFVSTLGRESIRLPKSSRNMEDNHVYPAWQKMNYTQIKSLWTQEDTGLERKLQNAWAMTKVAYLRVCGVTEADVMANDRGI